MEDILVFDSESNVIEVDPGEIEDINKIDDVQVEKVGENEREKIDKSELSISDSVNINGLRGIKTIDINKFTNYDNTLLWSNSNPSSNWSTNPTTINSYSEPR